MEEIINELLNIERKAQVIAKEATNMQLNLENMIRDRTTAIKNAIDMETKLKLKNRLDEEDKKVKTEIKSNRSKTDNKISTMQSSYVLNKDKIEEKIFYTIIGR
ncbi:MAG: hypothetical protein K0R15_2360 [Clostridiales bacterium]|nr:hypothetical protein [Clostridiales bacterium]